MRKALALLLGLLAPAAGALQGPWECQYGAACQLPVELYEPDGVLPYSGTAPNNTADFFVHCPSANTESSTAVTGTAKDGTFGFSFTIGAANMSCDRLKVVVRDADGPGTAYLTTMVAVETCGNASAARLNCASQLAVASTALTTATWTNARASYLDSLNGHTAQTGDSFALLNPMTEDVGGIRYTAAALSQAPSGTGSGDVTSWNGVPLSTVNPLPNAAPGGEGGLPTVTGTSLAQDVVVAGYAADVDFNALQSTTINTEVLTVVQGQRLHELMASPLAGQPAANSMFGDLTQDDGGGNQQFTANALALGPTAALTEEQLALALGGFIATITTVTNTTTFQLSTGPAAADSLNDEFTVAIRDTSNAAIPTCHRQVLDYVPPGTLVINAPCPTAFVVADGDTVVVLPNGTGAKVEALNVTNGAVETDLTVDVDGTLSLGCMLSAINAVQTGAQTVVGGTDYTYRNPGDTENRVVATRTASGRSQATITCPAGL